MKRRDPTEKLFGVQYRLLALFMGQGYNNFLSDVRKIYEEFRSNPSKTPDEFARELETLENTQLLEYIKTSNRQLLDPFYGLLMKRPDDETVVNVAKSLEKTLKEKMNKE